MTTLEQLQSLCSKTYTSEEGEVYAMVLKPGLNEEQIKSLTNHLPTGEIPHDINELLKYTGGFEFYGLDDITFDGIGLLGFEELFPYSVQLAGDGFGNFWILDINKKGQWGHVFFVCHDPAVVVKQSENLAQFIQHIDEFGALGSQSTLDIIHEKTVMEIWEKDHELIPLETAKNAKDHELKTFALSLPDHYVIADLRNQDNQKGFAWGKYGADLQKTIRHDTELLWGIEKKVKKSFLSKLLGR